MFLQEGCFTNNRCHKTIRLLNNAHANRPESCSVRAGEVHRLQEQDLRRSEICCVGFSKPAA